MNFTSGDVQQPSKNIGQQKVFRSSDPYAGQSRVANAWERQRLRVDSMPRQSPFLQTVGGAEMQPQMTPAMQPFGPPPPVMGQPTMQPPGDPYAAYGGMNPNMDIRNAAQLFGGAVAGNPFIDPEELARMQAGYAPLEQGINPAFYRYTSPVIQQALAGLRQSVGYRPEDAQFITRQFTPGSLF